MENRIEPINEKIQCSMDLDNNKKEIENEMNELDKFQFVK